MSEQGRNGKGLEFLGLAPFFGMGVGARWTENRPLTVVSMFSRLLKNTGFVSLFIVQFAGGFHDHFLKQCLLFLYVFRGFESGPVGAVQFSELLSLVFVLLFLLCSGTAGQLADKLEKSRNIRSLKLLEFLTALLTAVGFLTNSLALLLGGFCLLGLQSALFGPHKYGILPQLLRRDDLLAANSLMEPSTRIAIMLGLVAAGFCSSRADAPVFCSGVVVATSLLGLLAAQFLPKTKPIAPELKLSFNPISAGLQVLRLGRKRAHLGPILGISWFWSFSGALLALLPAYGKTVLQVPVSVVTSLLVLSTIGLGLGSLLCAWLSKGRLRLGYVPVGGVGISLFLLDFTLSPTGSEMWSFASFWRSYTGLRLGLDILALSVCTGPYIVPLYTYLQLSSRQERLSRVVAANNLVNSLCIVSSLVGLTVLGRLGFDVWQKFLFLTLANVAVSLLLVFGLRTLKRELSVKKVKS